MSTYASTFHLANHFLDVQYEARGEKLALIGLLWYAPIFPCHTRYTTIWHLLHFHNILVRSLQKASISK
eukprot:c43991_g1_i1 orf=67-273(+)